jgi:hypothetical protein
MRGGMSMIGDMFNSSLKSRVDALCSDLAALVANQPGLIRSGHGGSLSFSSQYGLVDVASLPVISVNGAPPPPPAFTPAPSASQPAQSAPPFNPASSDAKADILATIEQLADLRAKGILGDEKLNTKKAQLLSRL